MDLTRSCAAENGQSVRISFLLICLAACGAPRTAPHQPVPAPPTPLERTRNQVIDHATEALARGDVAGARRGLERERWIAEDRARAALLLFGCLLLEKRLADGIEVLREYLQKTPRIKSEGDRIAVRLLRHHASGGGLRARTATEACYFGLYALQALEEPETARPDLLWALEEAPLPEHYLVEQVAP